MHVVALTRWNARGLEAELPILAVELGLGLYDARLKLVGGLPVVVQKALAPEAAQQLLLMLRGRGHGAVACDADKFAQPEQLRIAQSFEFATDSCRFSADRRETLTSPYAAIVAVVRAVEQNEVSHTLESKEKKFDLGRAVMTGGVMLNKTVKKSESNASQEQQQVAYLFAKNTAAPLLLKEYELNYAGLGSELRAGTRPNFEALLARLRKLAPEALHDQRMLTHKRKLELTSVRGPSNERTVSNSNAGANALAAQLLWAAQLEGQL